MLPFTTFSVAGQSPGGKLAFQAFLKLRTETAQRPPSSQVSPPCRTMQVVKGDKVALAMKWALHFRCNLLLNFEPEKRELFLWKANTIS